MIHYEKRTPAGLLAEKYYQQLHYADSVTLDVKSGSVISFGELMDISFNDSKWWINVLLVIRNVLVKPFGLQTGNVYESHPKKQIREPEIGDRIAVFTVLDKSENETLLFYDDKHLDAWFSFLLTGNQKRTLRFTTLVYYKNFLGRAYFFVIRPFHILIVKSLARRLEKHLNSNQIK